MPIPRSTSLAMTLSFATVATLLVAAPAPAETRSAEQAVQRPSRAHGATVARVITSTIARSRLGSRAGRRWRVRTQTAWSGQQQSLLVLDSSRFRKRLWLKVLLPVRPNGSTGWIPRDRVALRRTPYWVDIQTLARRVLVFRDGRRVRAMRAVVGKPRTPTPGGLAAIYERNRQPNPRGFLGPWVLPLTSLSKVLKNFGGGPGRIGIHGRDGASLGDPLGSARSHGCVRIDNHQIRWMASHLPIGTPVRVTG